MKRFWTLCVLLGCAGLSYAQTDLPQSRQLDISAEDPNKGITPKTGLAIPPEIGKIPDFSLEDPNEQPTVKMLPDRNLKQAGHDLVIKPRIGELQQGKSNKHYGDMYLGDFKTGAKYVGIVCRDHEFVDGDRVRIFVNGRVAEHNILLTGSYKGVNVELDQGFNRLDFEALNQGSTGPNTAQVDVYDEKGQLLYSNKWLLSTGSKASLVIVKEGE